MREVRISPDPRTTQHGVPRSGRIAVLPYAATEGTTKGGKPFLVSRPCCVKDREIQPRMSADAERLAVGHEHTLDRIGLDGHGDLGHRLGITGAAVNPELLLAVSHTTGGAREGVRVDGVVAAVLKAARVPTVGTYTASPGPRVKPPLAVADGVTPPLELGVAEPSAPDEAPKLSWQPTT